MPYNKPPKRIKNLPKKAQEAWIKAFNNAFKTYKKDKDQESKANAIAWSIVKKMGYKKDKTGKWSKMVGEITASILDPSGITKDVTFKNKKKRGKSKMKKETKLGYDERGKRDGTGPYKGSYQRSISDKGKRQEIGEKCIKPKKMAKFKKWTTEYKNNLPDSSFAVIIKEGDKKIRKLPYKDMEGKVDIPHLRNALARVMQRKTELSPTMRAKAIKKLRTIAQTYLKSNKETKSGEIMSKMISKFEADVSDRLAAIITALKERSTGKKPDDEIHLTVKRISLLIQDLEEIAELERKDKELKDEEKKEETTDSAKEDNKEEKEQIAEKEESKETKTEEKENRENKKIDGKKEEDEVKDNKEEKEGDKESTKEDDEEESKFKEALKLCGEYQSELEKKDKLISKFKSQVDKIQSDNKKLEQEMSKFKSERYNKTLSDTIQKVSKFKGLSDSETLSLRKGYLESKMSESALEEIGRITDEKMFSKLEEPKVTTKPSEMLEPAGEKDEEFSKMSREEQLDKLAQIQAKNKGFVQ